MAFRSNGPVTLALPPFRGAVRRIVLLAVGAFFLFLVLGLFSNFASIQLGNLLALQPASALWPSSLLLWKPWQLITYAFVPSGLLGSAFALLSLWMFASTLEDERGTRWFTEYFLASTVGGALLASLLTFLFALAKLPLPGPESVTAGLWPSVLAVMLAFARFHGEEEVRLYFVLNLKAKYLVAIYLLVYMVLALTGGNRFGALTAVCAAAAGFLYLRLFPRSGIGLAGSESWYSLRNAWHRYQRRRAAKKFTVYMRKQGKDVSIDESGRYIDPSGTPRAPNDRRWMN